MSPSLSPAPPRRDWVLPSPSPLPRDYVSAWVLGAERGVPSLSLSRDSTGVEVRYHTALEERVRRLNVPVTRAGQVSLPL